MHLPFLLACAGSTVIVDTDTDADSASPPAGVWVAFALRSGHEPDYTCTVEGFGVVYSELDSAALVVPDASIAVTWNDGSSSMELDASGIQWQTMLGGQACVEAHSEVRWTFDMPDLPPAGCTDAVPGVPFGATLDAGADGLWTPRTEDLTVTVPDDEDADTYAIEVSGTCISGGYQQLGWHDRAPEIVVPAGTVVFAPEAEACDTNVAIYPLGRATCDAALGRSEVTSLGIGLALPIPVSP